MGKEKNEEIEEVKEELKEVKEKSKRTNTLAVTVAVIGFMFGFFMFGWILGITRGYEESKIIDENKEAIEQKEAADQTKVYETTDENIVKLLKKLYVFRLTYSGKNLEAYLLDRKFTVDEIPAKNAYLMVQEEFQDKESVSYEEFNKAVKRVLGKDYNFAITSDAVKSLYAPLFEYDEGTKTFHKIESIGGLTSGGTSTDYRIAKAVEKDGTLEITVNVLFSCSNGEAYCSDYAKTNEVAKLGQFEVPYEKGSKYVFTFKNEDGHFVFVSSEPVK